MLKSTVRINRLQVEFESIPVGRENLTPTEELCVIWMTKFPDEGLASNNLFKLNSYNIIFLSYLKDDGIEED